jgi:RNA polymerase sigma-70 factor (ECF subfamily)
MTKNDLEKLIEIYGNDIYQFCYHLTGSRVDADDLYQETLYKAFEIRGKIKDPTDSSFKKERNYCMGIATRIYKNNYRKRIRHNEESLDNEQFDYNLELSSDFNTEELVEKEQINLYLRKCIYALPFKQRKVIYLFYFADMSVKDISTVLRIPEGTVKSRLNTAKGTLKIKLEEKGYE